MMIQKNIDLQMEALELLQQRFTLKPTFIFSFLEIHSQSILEIHSPCLKSILLNSRYGVLPESLQPSKESAPAPVEGEDRVMQEVTRLVQD